MIPKLVHWVWLYEPPPAWAMQNIHSFECIHTNWDFKIWSEPPANFPSDLMDLMDRLPYYSSKSDILRYWLVYEYGGLYLDCDNVTFRNFDQLLDTPFFTAKCMPKPHTDWHIAGCLFGSEPKSVASQMILDEIRFNAHLETFKRITFGPDLMSKLFLDKQLDCITMYPSHYFFLWDNHQTAMEYCEANDTKKKEMLATKSISWDERPISVHCWGMEGSSFRQMT